MKSPGYNSYGNHAPKTCFCPQRISANYRHNCVLWEEQTWAQQPVRNLNRLNWLSALYGPTLSSTQMLPERSSRFSTRRLQQLWQPRSENLLLSTTDFGKLSSQLRFMRGTDLGAAARSQP